MNLAKVRVVAAREYRSTVRTKAFVIAIVLMPVLMFGGITAQVLLEDRVDADDKRIAVLDRSGALFDALAEEAEIYNSHTIDEETGEQRKPKFELARQTVDEERIDEARVELSNRVRDKELLAFVEIPPDVLDTGKTAAPLIRYYSNQPTYNDVRRWLERVANDRARGVRLAAAGLDRSIVEKAMTPVGVENLGLVERTDSGAIKEAETVNPIATFMVPFALIMLMWVALAMTVQPILNGVIEEKMQRISEVLLGSVPPFELMLGKLIGYVGVAITLVGLYMIGGWTVANHLGKTDMVPVELIGWFVLFLTIAILMFGSLFLAAGACCNDLKEAQNLVLPIWIIAAFPLIAMPVVLEHPNSPFAIGLSLVPTASPMLMVLRMAVPPGIAWWELPVSIVGSLAATLLFVWVAGRIFRVGMLMQGKPPKITEIAGWVLRG